MHGSYTQRRIKALSERGKRMAAARWKKDRERIELEMPARIQQLAEWDVWNLPRKQGDALGCIQWHDFRTGKVRRWTVRIGDRTDRITVESPGEKPSASHGWTWFLTRLRKHLS
jgi:hypothetical protein